MFSVTVESVLLYSYEAWIITLKELDGCYIRLLRCVLNIHWKQHITNAELYVDMPKITKKIMERRTKFAGLCVRSEECVSKMVNWTPKHGMMRPGRLVLNYNDILKHDTGLHSSDVITAMHTCEWYDNSFARQESVACHCGSRTPLESSM